MSRELDEECARAMGWEKRYSPDPTIFAWETPGGNRVAAENLRHYSTDYAAARWLEDEIERQGKGAAYARELSTIIGMAYLDLEANSDAVDQELWRLLRATPEQRVRAFLKVMSK